MVQGTKLPGIMVHPDRFFFGPCLTTSEYWSEYSSYNFLNHVKATANCVCGWSANLESKWLAVFCSLRRLLLGTLLFEITFNCWRFRHYLRAAFICIMLTRLMWLVGTLMRLVGILDVVCGTLK